MTKPYITGTDKNPLLSLALSEMLAYHCNLSYHKPKETFYQTTDTLDILTGNPFIKHAETFDRQHAQGHAFVFENKAFLIFRGTESLVDWARNIKAQLKPVDNDTDALVHTGFLQNLNLIWDDILAWFSKLPATDSVICSGHSLGGAMATIAAYRLSRLEFPIARVVNFGSPRPGNYNFAKSYEQLGLDKRTWRIVWGDDAVTKLPDPLRYKHVGKELNYLSERQFAKELVGKDLAGQGPSELWNIAANFSTMFDRAGAAYLTIKALPQIIGFTQSGLDHKFNAGYSNVFRSMMHTQITGYSYSAHTKTDGSVQDDLQVFLAMHRAYITGLGFNGRRRT